MQTKWTTDDLERRLQNLESTVDSLAERLTRLTTALESRIDGVITDLRHGDTDYRFARIECEISSLREDLRS